jgi:hypothetical protein
MGRSKELADKKKKFEQQADAYVDRLGQASAARNAHYLGGIQPEEKKKKK